MPRSVGAIRTVIAATLAPLLCSALVIASPASAQDAPETIRVAGLADVELFRGAEVGARARIQAVNAAGGIHGKQIELIGVVDDQRNPGVAQAEIARLVEEEQVEAVVPVVTSRFTDDGTLERAQVPAFGWGISSGFCGNRWAFAITGCLAPILPRQVPTIWGELVAEELRERGIEDPSVALVTERGGNPRTVRELRAIVESAGLRVVDTLAELDASQDPAPTATAVATTITGAADPPDAVFTVATFATVGAFQDALRAQGYGGVMTNVVQYGPALAAPATGAFVLTQFATPESAPDNAAMQQIVAEIGAVTTDAITPAMLAGWFAADEFVRARRAARADASPADVGKTASTMRYRVKDTLGPTKYPSAFVRPTSCGQLVTSDGAAYSVAVPFRCARYARV